jgi:uncharacterized RDD family membrane protein YckC
MNPSDVQSETEPKYFDPEEIDMSEQQFAASLEIRAEKADFFLDDERDAPSSEPTQRSADSPAAEQLTDRIGSNALHGEAVAGELQPNLPQTAIGASSTQQEQDAEPDWRHLVSAKVSSYKARKPQKERYPSLKLQFDAPVPRPLVTREPMNRVKAQEDRADFVSIASDLPAALLPEQPSSPPRILLEATARVIEFPRPVAPRGDELADPVIDRPRIIEAPELLPPPPAMGGILMAPLVQPEPERRPGFDVPLQSAALRLRIAAGLFDAAVVSIAMALFGYVVFRINGAMPPLRTAATLAAGLFAVLWPAYQYTFLVFCGSTPGLWASKLRISRFDGEPVSRNLRRWRAVASVLSLASLGLGYGWCFLDEDQLSWHDRITRTHLAPSRR